MAARAMPVAPVALGLAACVLASALGPSRGLAAVAPASPGAWSVAANPMVSRLALASTSITAPRDPEREKKPGRKSRKERQAESEGSEGLGPERARILLRSLTVPGWGQATLGRRGSARAFLVAEAGIWGAFTAFRIQQAQRTDAYLRTARLEAGIDLREEDDEFRSIVGAFASSDEYNLLVVARDAANLYLSDPDHQDLAGYRAYVDEHSLKGDQTWQWSDEAAFRRYGGQRKFAQRAGLRANTALGLAVANRLVSALHAARQAGRAAPPARSWRLEVRPGLEEPGAFRAALTTRF